MSTFWTLWDKRVDVSFQVDVTFLRQRSLLLLWLTEEWEGIPVGYLSLARLLYSDAQRDATSPSPSALKSSDLRLTGLLSLFLPPVADMGQALMPFTLNFTITNLFYTPDMGHQGSEKFNFTEKVLNHLVRALQSLRWPASSAPHPAPWLPHSSPSHLPLSLVLCSRTPVSAHSTLTAD